ncbi:hypothetical protein FRC08_003592 [Ceratobasidium sp. 394]|nr:hypothetical protein FRC08_003592 [Ceratobasidium sp. 394]
MRKTRRKTRKRGEAVVWARRKRNTVVTRWRGGGEPKQIYPVAEDKEEEPGTGPPDIHPAPPPRSTAPTKITRRLMRPPPARFIHLPRPLAMLSPRYTSPTTTSVRSAAIQLLARWCPDQTSPGMFFFLFPLDLSLTAYTRPLPRRKTTTRKPSFAPVHSLLSHRPAVSAQQQPLADAAGRSL